MSDKLFMKKFNDAVAMVTAQSDMGLFKQAVDALCNTFPTAYNLATGRQEKKELVDRFTDFIAWIAEREPRRDDIILCYAGSVQSLCSTLAGNVDDKSIIPENFGKRILVAGIRLYEVSAGTKNAAAAAQAAEILKKSSGQFPTMLSAPPPRPW